MTADSSDPRFFIALQPPRDVQDYAIAVIQELRDRFNTKTSTAPPHITLQPPFHWSLDAVADLEACLDAFSSQATAVSIALSGFGAFKPRVLYINVAKTPELLSLQASLMAHLEDQLGIVDPVSKSRPFSPHVTVASRNINRRIFQQAWSELQPREVEFQFTGDRLTLFQHDGRQWQTHAEFPLLNQNS